MSCLKCNANTCDNNVNGYCCKEHIDVTGHHACTSDDTCCSDFVDHTASNCTHHADATTDISCNATDCKHNCDGHCHAHDVDVAGYGASNCSQTCCSSFVPEH